MAKNELMLIDAITDLMFTCMPLPKQDTDGGRYYGWGPEGQLVTENNIARNYGALFIDEKNKTVQDDYGDILSVNVYKSTYIEKYYSEVVLHNFNEKEERFRYKADGLKRIQHAVHLNDDTILAFVYDLMTPHHLQLVKVNVSDKVEKEVGDVHASNVTGVHSTPDGTSFAIGLGEHQRRIIVFGRDKFTYVMEDPEKIYDLKISPDGSRLAVVTKDRILKVYQLKYDRPYVESASTVTTIPAYTSTDWKILWHPAEPRLIIINGYYGGFIMHAS